MEVSISLLRFAKPVLAFSGPGASFPAYSSRFVSPALCLALLFFRLMHHLAGISMPKRLDCLGLSSSIGLASWAHASNLHHVCEGLHLADAAFLLVSKCDCSMRDQPRLFSPRWSRLPVSFGAPLVPLYFAADTVSPVPRSSGSTPSQRDHREMLFSVAWMLISRHAREALFLSRRSLVANELIVRCALHVLRGDGCVRPVPRQQCTTRIVAGTVAAERSRA